MGGGMSGAIEAPLSTSSSSSQPLSESHSLSIHTEPHTEPRPQKELAAVASPEDEPAAISTAAPQKIQPPAPEEDLSFRPRPQWLEPGQGSPGGGIGAGDETLQRAKERVASRWFALKDLFTHSTPAAERPGEQQRERRVPVIAIFSFAGGVGKTSLIATLGRALASHGERVLLADTTPFGLLPFYFGARDLKAGVVRTFAPPNNSSDAPVDVVTLDERRARPAGGSSSPRGAAPPAHSGRCPNRLGSCGAQPVSPYANRVGAPSSGDELGGERECD